MSEIVTEKSWRITPVGSGRRDYSQNVERYDVEPSMLLLEGFEQLPPSWVTEGSGGYSVNRVTDRAWRGGACLRLTTGTDPAANFAGYTQNFGLVRSMKLSADLRATVNVLGDELQINLQRWTGTHLVMFSVGYHMDPAVEKWMYRDATGVFVDVPDGGQALGYDIFHHMWLAVDFKAEEYLYAMCNEKFMDLKGLKPRVIPDLVTKPSTRINIATLSAATPNLIFHIDNVRVAEVV